VSQIDFYFSLAKASAHTGIKIQAKTWKKPTANLIEASSTKLLDRPNKNIAPALHPRVKTSAGLMRLAF
jgi:hypothetical protein